MPRSMLNCSCRRFRSIYWVIALNVYLANIPLRAHARSQIDNNYLFIDWIRGGCGWTKWVWALIHVHAISVPCFFASPSSFFFHVSLLWFTFVVKTNRRNVILVPVHEQLAIAAIAICNYWDQVLGCIPAKLVPLCNSNRFRSDCTRISNYDAGIVRERWSKHKKGKNCCRKMTSDSNRSSLVLLRALRERQKTIESLHLNVEWI